MPCSVCQTQLRNPYFQYASSITCHNALHSDLKNLNNARPILDNLLYHEYQSLYLLLRPIHKRDGHNLGTEDQFHQMGYAIEIRISSRTPDIESSREGARSAGT